MRFIDPDLVYTLMSPKLHLRQLEICHARVDLQAADLCQEQLLVECILCAQDFVSAVMDVDYSPTGREFVAGSYDRSVRIFAYNGGHSREVYHTKRMQRVFAVRFSGDASYVFSGSDDMNLRVWKVRHSTDCGGGPPPVKVVADLGLF